MSLWFIEAAFKISCVLAGVAAVNRLCRRTSAASRHMVWTLAVAGVLVLPMLSAALPAWDVAIPVATATVARD